MTEKKAKIENETTKAVIKKKFNGTVVSAKSDKTLIVSVNRVKIHPKYQKRYHVSKKYKVHDEKNAFREGETVTFVECRPLSKDKKWRVIYT